MARNKHQPKEIIFNLALLRNFEFSQSGFLLRFKFAAYFLMFAIEKLGAAEMVQRSMLGSGHEPSAGIVGNAGLGPSFERDDECVLCELFGKADVADDASEARDEPRRLNA